MVRFQHFLNGIAILALLATAAVAQESTTPAPAETPAQAEPPATSDSPGTPDSQDTEEPADDFSLGEVPDEIETIELTPDLAKKALDVYVIVREKYKDADLENYDSLQDFVDQNAQGKFFDADVKAAGFTDVNQWNLAITTLSFAYSNTLEDQTDDIRQEIENVKNDPDLAQDIKDRMVKSFEAMIPSANNTKIVEELIKDQTYAEKLKGLDVESE
jgi:hypothetical protein